MYEISDYLVFISISYSVTFMTVGDDENDNRSRTNTITTSSVAYVRVDVFAQRIALLKNVTHMLKRYYYNGILRTVFE